MKYWITVIATLITLHTWAQEFNNYKYVVVDNQYEFQNESNEYQLNDLAVFELNKRGLTAFKNDKVQPGDKNLGVCNTLQMKVQSGGTLDRRLTLSFVDCEGNLVFTTQEGIGREKDNKRAYYKAMREAMKSLDNINYNYQPQEENPSTDSKSIVVSRNPILETAPVTADVVKNKTAVDKPLQRPVTTMVYDYSATNTSYHLKASGDNFTIYNGDIFIGNLKKSGGGCYLAMTNNFIGIGYFNDEILMIEANFNGEEVRLAFTKN